MRWRTAHARRRRRRTLVVPVDARAFGLWLLELLGDSGLKALLPTWPGERNPAP